MFGTIPRTVDGLVGPHRVRGYPSLVDEGDSVGLTLWTTPTEQAGEAWAGTARLLLVTAPVTTGAARRALTKDARLAIGQAGYATIEELLEDCAVATVDRILATHGGPAWDEAGFDDLVVATRTDGPETAAAVVSFAGGILVAAARIRARLARLSAPALRPAVLDVTDQLDDLVRRHFVQATGAARLPDVLRYLRAINRRLDKLPEDPARDAQKMEAVRALAEDYRAALRVSTAPSAQRQEVRWMLEELRVSEFAQTLGTAYPVSVPRVRRAIAAL
jgi:ATP-dependent helicase HrpA